MVFYSSPDCGPDSHDWGIYLSSMLMRGPHPFRCSRS